MEMKSQIIKTLILNVILITILLAVPIEVANDLCLFKKLFGINCWNCGMTRAFLSMLHLDFDSAYKYNNKVFVVFPMTIVIYIYSCFKYIKKGERIK